MIKDEVTIGPCRLILGECLDVLPDIEGIDAVVTDPPFCSGGATEAGKGRSTHQGLRTSTAKATRFKWFDSDNMTTAGLCELLRQMCVRADIGDSGSILAFCDWRMISMLSPAMESAGLRLRNIIVWNKGHFGCGTGFRPQHEMILHLTKRSPKFWSASVGNVITVSRESDKQHPTEKPVELIEELIRVSCPVGGLVVDSFMGGGTTGVAAIRTGRRFTGIERDRTYFETSIKRIEQAWSVKQSEIPFEPELPMEQSQFWELEPEEQVEKSEN